MSLETSFYHKKHREQSSSTLLITLKSPIRGESLSLSFLCIHVSYRTAVTHLSTSQLGPLSEAAHETIVTVGAN